MLASSYDVEKIVLDGVELNLPNPKTSLDDFMQNIDVDYAFDADTDANYTIIRTYKNRIDGSKQFPFVYAPNGVNAGTMSTYDLVTNEGWLLAINSGVFDTSDCTPDGILIQNGVVLQNSPTDTHAKCMPLTIDADGNLGYAEYNADADELVENGIISAVTGFMPIIIDYESVDSSQWNNVDHYSQNAQRQIIGQFGNGDYAIITCEGRNFDNSDGWTIAEAQKICQKHGLKFAYNLDGGGSTETMLGKKHINTIYEGSTGRKVPTFIVFNGTTAFDKETIVQRVPSGYTELSYLTPPAGAYFDTGIPATADYDFEAKFQAGSQHVLSSYGYYYPTLFESNGRKLRYNRYGSETMVDYTFSYLNDYVIEVNGENVSVNGEVVTTNAAKGTTSPIGNLFMFCYGGAPTTSKYHWIDNNRFYYLKLFEKETGKLLYDYIPCKNPDGVIGLYETVNKKFYSSDTDVSFTGV